VKSGVGKLGSAGISSHRETMNVHLHQTTFT
jgi:hypothetical protein